MADPIVDTIVENATAPKSVETDGMKVAEHSIPDQIAAERFRRKAAQADATPAARLPFRSGVFRGGHPAR